MPQATVYSAAKYGLADDSTATGLLVARVNYAGTSDVPEALDHLGCVAGFAVVNARKTVSCDGVVKTKGSGLAGSIGSVISLANTTADSRTKNSEGLGATPNANAGIVVTECTLEPQQSGFETGGLSGVYFPYVATNSPATL